MEDKDAYRPFSGKHHELFHNGETPFALKNAPTTFHGATDIILKQVKRKFATV